MNKNVIVSILVALIVLLGLWTIFESRPQDPKVVVEQEVCDPYANLDLIIASQDMSACDCLETEEERDLCRDNISDIITYDRAIEEANLNLCAELSTEALQQTCIKLVEEFLEFQKGFPSQVIAETVEIPDDDL